MGKIIDRGQIGVLDPQDQVRIQTGHCGRVAGNRGVCESPKEETLSIGAYFQRETEFFIEQRCFTAYSPLDALHDLLQENSATISSVSPELMQQLVDQEIACARQNPAEVAGTPNGPAAEFLISALLTGLQYVLEQMGLSADRSDEPPLEQPLNF